MNSIIKSKNCLPITLVLFIVIIIISLKHVNYSSKIFLVLCLISQILALIAVFIENKKLLGLTHIACGIGFLYGSLFIKDKILNIVILSKLLFIIYTRHVRGNCMYDAFSKKYMDKLPLNDDFGNVFYFSFLILNIYNFLYINKIN